MSAALNVPWARLFLRRLADAGVAHLVLSPGSRSTPFVFAAAEVFEGRTTTIVDERAAAFHALGFARASGAPVALVCTSGTAAAHWFPALIEAGATGVPLIAITADRPPELQHRAAPQTIDQVKLFGGHVRRYFELGLPDDDPRALDGLEATAALAVATARAPSAGPVHVNAWFRKPLEPRPEARRDAAQRAFEAQVAARLARPAVRRVPPRRLPDPRAVDELAAQCRSTAEGLIVCGPGPLAQRALLAPLQRLARATGYPLLVEAASQLRFAPPDTPDDARVDVFDPLLRAASFAGARDAKLVLQVGAPPTSKGFEMLVDARPDLVRWVLTAHGWNDPYNRAAAVVAAALPETLSALADALGDAGRGPGAWRRAWQDAGAHAAAVAAALAAEHPAGEAALVRAVLEALPDDALLVLGNSLPVREVDLFCPRGSAALHVIAQRGANGIDGLVAGAAGAARALGGTRPVVLLVGDVSFLHDHGALAACPKDVPLTIVVVDNGGGRLFELLPVADDPAHRARFEHDFLTPPALALEPLAAAHGVSFVRAASPAAVRAVAWSAPGTRLVHATVDGSLTRALHGALHERVARALA